MKGTRVAKAAGAGILVAAVLLSQSVRASEIGEQLDAIVKAYRAGARQLVRGRGVAKVTFEHYGEGQESTRQLCVVDFVFAEGSFRSDQYEIVGHERVFVHSAADDGERHLSYNGRYVLLETPSQRSFWHQPGRDFRPETFSSDGGVTFEDNMEYFRKGYRDDEITISHTEGGLLQIKGERKDASANEYSLTLYLLDPKADYRPLEHESVYDCAEYRVHYHQEAKWERFGSEFQWYPRSYLQEEELTRRGPSGEESRTEHSRRTVSIEQFDPDAQIADKEFSIEGLGVSPGTRIIDGVAGVVYSFRGQGPVTAEALASVLEESSLGRLRTSGEPGTEAKVREARSTVPRATDVREACDARKLVPVVIGLVALMAAAAIGWWLRRVRASRPVGNER